MFLTKIVTATDFSEASLPAMEAAFILAAENNATLYLVHVVEHPAAVDPLTGVGRPYLDDLITKSEEQLQHFIPRNLRQMENGLTIETKVLLGSPAEEIAALAAEENADLIVVGTHGRKGLARVLLGSTAESILRESPCQVLVVKPKSGATSKSARQSESAGSAR